MAGQGFMTVALLVIAGLWLPAFGAEEPPTAAQRPRLIVLTDIGGGDPDDQQSLIRLMVHGREILHLTATPGSVVELSSVGSTDPDGDSVRPRWWFYPEASSYRASVEIAGRDTPQAKVSIPADADQKSLHIILELQDTGTPPLTRYRRAVIHAEK